MTKTKAAGLENRTLLLWDIRSAFSCVFRIIYVLAAAINEAVLHRAYPFRFTSAHWGRLHLAPGWMPALASKAKLTFLKPSVYTPYRCPPAKND